MAKKSRGFAGPLPHIDVEHAEQLLRRLPVVDEAQASALAPTRGAPTQLPQAARAPDQSPLFGQREEGDLELAVFFRAQEPPQRACEHSGSQRSAAEVPRAQPACRLQARGRRR
jgi:hypothetical protein